MTHSLNIIFLDDTSLNISIEKERLKDFYEAFLAKKNYQVEEFSGIYINPDKVKYILYGQIQENKESLIEK